jgi:glycerol-3-phosphate acyltransferase PlsY
MNDVAVTALGYLIGSIPFAFLVARRHGVDLRQVGSLNVGATNVLRSTGIADALFAMSLDVVKGVVAVMVAQRIAGGAGGAVAAGLGAIVGHVYPVWLGFRGGKGVATAAGVFAVLAPAALAIAGAVFVLVVGTTRYISAGSLAATVTLAVATLVTSAPMVVTAGAALAAAVIVHRHRANLSRLLAGTERRVGM